MFQLRVRQALGLMSLLAWGLPTFVVATIFGTVLWLLSGFFVALRLDSVAVAIPSVIAIVAGIATLASGFMLAMSRGWRLSDNILALGKEDPDTVFICYTGTDRTRAFAADQALTAAGFTVSMYDPKARFADPVSKVAKSIERAAVVIVMDDLKHASDWIVAELGYAHLLRKQVLFIGPGESPDLGRIRRLAGAINGDRLILGQHRYSLIKEAFGGRVAEDELERSTELANAAADLDWYDETVDSKRQVNEGCFVYMLYFYAGCSGAFLSAVAVLAWLLWGPFF
jgi:hypothetical protein